MKRKLSLTGAFLALILLILPGCRRAEVFREVPVEETVEYGGSTYRLREGLTTVLILGLNQYEGEKPEGYTNDWEAGMLTLLVMDEWEGRCRMLHLEGSTAAAIRPLGTESEQAIPGTLARAFTYGSGGSDSSLNTVRAASGLLDGVAIDHYMTLTMEGTMLLTDALGGVAVTVLEDLTACDPALILGQTVKLTGKQARIYLRTEGGGAENRRRQFMDVLYETLLERYCREPGTMADALMALGEDFTTDCSASELEVLWLTMAACAVRHLEPLPGEWVEGENGRVFCLEETALEETVLALFYEKTGG